MTKIDKSERVIIFWNSVLIEIFDLRQLALYKYFIDIDIDIRSEHE